MRSAGYRRICNKSCEHPLLSYILAAFLMMFSLATAGFCQTKLEPFGDAEPGIFTGLFAGNGLSSYSHFLKYVRCENAAEAYVESDTLFPVELVAPSSDLDFVSPCVATMPVDSATGDAPESATNVPTNVSSSRRTSSMDISAAQEEEQSEKVQWKSLMKASSMYLGVMHGFRLATERGTRAALHNSVLGGYFSALGAMHGWSDGDGYYENYLGHPIEGGVSSYIWIHNDEKYRTVEFGKSRDYWMSRFRAYAYAWAFSEQFEIGPLSEASIGQIQRYCCAYGFVDHVITANFGMIWVVGGDALDRYVVRRIEDRRSNVVIRAIARSALNPPLTFANLMASQAPWHRDDRAGIQRYSGELYSHQPSDAETDPTALPDIPKLELTAVVPTLTRYGNMSCLGGGGVAGFHISDSWQWTGEMGGCTLGNNRAPGWSGDSLTFLTGPQWISHTNNRWSPYFHARFGGQKITEDYCLEYESSKDLTDKRLCKTDVTGFAKHYESTGMAFSTGTGVDIRINRALEAHLVSLDYIHSWLGPVAGTDFNNGFRLSVGLGLKVGTW